MEKVKSELQEMQLLTKQDIATYLNVSTSTVDKMMANKLISYLKIGGTVRFNQTTFLKEIEDYNVAAKQRA